jgi:beta,beta-carotene 9',10'-dioxygenase
MPEWLNGDYFTSGPSQFEMGDVKLGMAVDGFGRFNRFEILNGQVSFTSKMLDSTWLKLCQGNNDIEPNLLFEETTPPRMRSKIPGMNLYYATKYGDNVFVQLLQMPDKKTVVATTDRPDPLIFNTETLKQEGTLHWDDKIACSLGITHAKTLKDGTMVSYCSNTGMTNTINVYKINPATPKTRESIGIFKTENLAYGHSFGLTEDYALVLEQPIKFDTLNMIEGKPMI